MMKKLIDIILWLILAAFILGVCIAEYIVKAEIYKYIWNN